MFAQKMSRAIMAFSLTSLFRSLKLEVRAGMMTLWYLMMSGTRYSEK